MIGSIADLSHGSLTYLNQQNNYMNPLYRFFFKPTIPDRYWWAWMTACLCVVLAVLVVLLLTKGAWWCAAFNTMTMIWNGLTCWVNWGIYSEWKKNQPPT
jgi:hypothetical protein